jgi:hypothetical protein
MGSRAKSYLHLTRQLLARDQVDGEPGHAAANRVYLGLRDSLAPVIGASGFRALVARSVRLTTSDRPELRALLTPRAPALAAEDGPEQGAFDALSVLEPAVASSAAAEVLAELLSLIATFIGERLMRQLVGNAFPGIDVNAAENNE